LLALLNSQIQVASLSLQAGKDLVNEKCWPKKCLEESPEHFFKAISILHVIEQGPDETHSVNSTRRRFRHDLIIMKCWKNKRESDPSNAVYKSWVSLAILA